MLVWWLGCSGRGSICCIVDPFTGGGNRIMFEVLRTHRMFMVDGNFNWVGHAKGRDFRSQQKTFALDDDGMMEA